MSEVATIDTNATEIAVPASPIMTPAQMLSAAVSQNAHIDTITKLMDMQERYDAVQARRAFDEAVSKAKADIEPAVKNRTGHNNKRYADFSAITRAIDPAASKHGLSYRFETFQDEGRISVTCIVSHKDGHSVSNTLAGPADSTGSKNAIQAIGSTLTYLQRYSLSQAFGLAATDDDDGQSATATISQEQFNLLQSLIDEKGANAPALCGIFGVAALADLPAIKFEDVRRMLEIKKPAQKEPNDD